MMDASLTTANAWRPMTSADLPTVEQISAQVHGRYAESQAVYAERLSLYPAGCFVWVADGAVAGLLVTHPWHDGAPPALGAMLGALPAHPSSYYLHDIALLPETRGSGAGRQATALTLDAARAAGLNVVTLVAVNGAETFWARQGFVVDPDRGAGYGPGTVTMQRAVS